MTSQEGPPVGAPAKIQLPPYPPFVNARTRSSLTSLGDSGKNPGGPGVPTPHAAQLKPVAAILDGGKSLGGTLYSDSNTPRRERRGMARAAAEISVADRVAAREQLREAKRQLQLEAKAAAYLPRNGETGEQALRTYRRLKVEPHRATSEVLAGAYPFLAESGLGSEGILIGQDAWSGAGFVYDPWVLYRLGILTNPNCLLAGVVGRGKSALAKSIATRSIAFGRKCYVPGDPKGEWTAVSRSVGGQAIALGDGVVARLNPLDEGPRPTYLTNPDGGQIVLSDAAWAQMVRQRRRPRRARLRRCGRGELSCAVVRACQRARCEKS